MIYAMRTITVKDGSSMIDEPVVLYRGDKEIELVFGVLQQSFKFGKSENLIKTSKASHGQLIIEKLDGNFIFSNISECENGKIKFVMTDFMIDELSEVGIYDIQIRLYDETIHSRISIPPIKNAIEVREPLTVANPAVADQGVVNLSIIDKAGEEEEIFDEEGSYIKTEWSPGDTITSAKLNKIESSLETINNNDIQKDIDTNAKIDEITERLDTGDVNIDLSDYAKTVDIPTKTSELTNDSNFLTYIPSTYVTEYELNAKGYLTEHQDLSDYAKTVDIPTKTSELINDSNFLSSVPSEYVTDSELNAKGYLTEHQDISNKVDKVSGKGLSTNDYTTVEKNKLAGIESGANKVIVYKAKECTTFSSDDGTCTPLAVQKAVGLFPPKNHEHSQYLTEHQDISNKADKSEIPTKTSELTNDSNFVSSVDLSSNLTLGYNTDGKLYIFFNGTPIGTGVEIATISGDVTGLIDENNDIILKGDLADGSYRIMYQYEDGSFSAPITVTVGEIETYANLLETAMEEGLTEVYNGIGYKANLRWSGSSNAFVSATRCVLTGLIPLGVNGDVLHIRGVDIVGYVDGRQSGWYHCYDSQGSRLQMSSGTIKTTMISTDENGDITITMNHSNLVLPSGTAYIRFQFGEITGDFIMSRNFLIP